MTPSFPFQDKHFSLDGGSIREEFLRVKGKRTQIHRQNINSLFLSNCYVQLSRQGRQGVGKTQKVRAALLFLLYERPVSIGLADAETAAVVITV